MIGHQINGIVKLISELIPSSTVSVKMVNFNKGIYPSAIKIKGHTGKFSGIRFEKGTLEFWIESNNCTFYIFSVMRKSIPLSKKERKILACLPQAIRSLMINETSKTIYTQQSISSQFSLQYLLIAQLLRGTNPSRCWTPILVIKLLQQLTFERYEGEGCSSGFICVKDSDLYLHEVESQGYYTFTRFRKSIYINDDFFNKPASYRYVDGKNSFYLLDNRGNVYGVLRNKHPEQFNIIDRCTANNIAMLTQIAHFKWVAHVGLNNDINIYCKHDIHIKWAKNKWQLREKNLIYNEMLNLKLNDIFAQQLSNTLITLSELRMGALLLVLDGDDKPKTIGKIDESPLGKELYTSMLNLKFSELLESNSILGLLSSDGLTTFNKDGYILDCGSIIDLTFVGKTSSVMGGGRSQAAYAASQYGLAIKVSEDGPISLYYDGRELIKL